MTTRSINLIVVHCSATRAAQNVGVKEIDRWHRERGFLKIGYHYVIKRDGAVEPGRPEEEVGAHVQGNNAHSIGVCLVGGLSADGKHGEDNFTPAQYASLATLIYGLRHRYPKARICGHRDLSPDRNHDGEITPDEWLKECPSFDVAKWLAQSAVMKD